MAVYCTNTKKCVVGHGGLYEASWTEEITLSTGGGVGKAYKLTLQRCGPREKAQVKEGRECKTLKKVSQQRK